MSDLSLSIMNAIAACNLVDLSKDVATSKSHGPFQTKIEVLEAEPGAKYFVEKLLPVYFSEGVGKIRPESFPSARFLRHEMVSLSTHAGSHLDAPGHYGGPLSATSFIDAAPLRNFIAPGLCFDGTKVEGDKICWEDFAQFTRREGIHAIEGHIVLIRTGQDKAIGVDTVEALLDRGVKVIGTDHESFDGPFIRMLLRYLETEDSDVLWPCHMIGRERPYYQYENLNNLDKLPAKDFVVWGPPVLIGGATASWARVLALVPQKGDQSDA